MGIDFDGKGTEAEHFYGKSQRGASSTFENASLDGMLNYGRCIGVINGDKVMVKPHTYSDGQPHYQNSDGLCPDCFRVAEAIRAQRKISKLEEKLNVQKCPPPLTPISLSDADLH